VGRRRKTSCSIEGHRRRLRNDGITHVGPGFAGTLDTTVDGRGLMVMPGLVNVHSHLGHEPAYRGIREEHGVANMYMSSLYERSQAFDVSDPELRRASLEVALCEVLKSGVTTVCDISPIYEGWTDIVGKSGIRGLWRRVSRAHDGSVRRSFARVRLGRGTRPQGSRGGARARRRAGKAPLRPCCPA
jgi:cytosine/adenosine deaminase-related metal-dependent hydrolase